MHAGGANFTSLLFMNVYRIYIFIDLFFLRPFVDELTKRGRSIWRVYICMFVFGEFINACFNQPLPRSALFPHLCKKGEKRIWRVYICMFVFGEFINAMQVYFLVCAKKGKKNLVSLSMFISLFMHICLCLVYAFHWISLCSLLCMS